MTYIGLPKHWKRMIIPSLSLILASCGIIIGDALPLTSTSRKIHANTQTTILGEYGNLSLGTSNHNQSEFIDDFGVIRNEMTAGLYARIENQPDTYRAFRVYAGQIIFFYYYKIQVLRFGADRDGGFIEVDVTNAKQSESSVSLALVTDETVEYNGPFGILNLLTEGYDDYYLDDQGNVIDGPTAMIKLWIEDQLAFKTQRIFMGQTILFKGYKILVTRMDIGRDGWFAMVEVGLA